MNTKVVYYAIGINVSVLVLIFLVFFLIRACAQEETGKPESVAPLPKFVETDAFIQIDSHVAFVPPGPKRLEDVPQNIEELIRQGAVRLESARLDKERCVPSKAGQIGWKRCLGDYVISAVDRSGKIELIEVYGSISVSPPGFSVTCERDGACDGGVNPPFIITSPPGWTAVAIRTAVYGEGPDGIGGAVYVPYSTRLNTPELRQTGLEYLRDAVLAAYYELRAKEVRSQFIAGSYVTDFGTPDHIVSLILTEQMWSDIEFVQGAHTQRLDMLDRALVTIGLNRWRSFQYTKSRADARGIGQIVGKPYRAIRDQYPRAELPEDHVQGRVDHHSAIKAMICHADAEWWALKQGSHREFLLENDWDRRIVLAAGYNANIATVVGAINACGQGWRAETCSALPTETRLYLVKYEWISKMLFDKGFRADVVSNID